MPCGQFSDNCCVSSESYFPGCLVSRDYLCPAVRFQTMDGCLLCPRMSRVRTLVVSRGQFLHNGCVFVASQAV
jgi:hypothetical protein